MHSASVDIGACGRIAKEERSQLEAQLAATRRQYLQLAAKLNFDIGLVRLPDELLVEILKWHIALWHHDQEAAAESLSTALSQGGRDVYGWITVTHVCRRWRYIALHTPTLWTRIKATNPACVRAFLERSRSIPVSVEGQMEFVDDIPVMPRLKSWLVVLKHSARIESLRLECYIRSELTERQAQVLSFGLPEFRGLRRLAIFGRGDVNRLPPAFKMLEGQSALEELEISQYPFAQIRTLLSPNLKRLAMSFTRSMVDPILMWQELLESLRHLPHLESLTVIEGFPPVPDVDEAVDEADLPLLLSSPVNLPRLTNFVAYTSRSAQSITTLAKNLSFPPDGRIQLSYGRSLSVWANPFDPAVIGSYVAKRLSALPTCTPPAALRTLSIGRSEDQCFPYYRASVVKGWLNAIPLLDRSPYLIADSALNGSRELFECTMFTPGLEPVLSYFVHRLPLASLQTLIFGDFSDTLPLRSASVPTEAAWRTIFAEAKGLTELCVEGTSATFLPHALCPGPEGEPILFPKLEMLKLHRVEFHEWRPDDQPMAGAWSSELVHALKARAESQEGAMLKLLVVTYSQRIEPAELNALQECVEHIKWDGVSFLADFTDDEEDEFEGLEDED